MNAKLFCLFLCLTFQSPLVFGSDSIPIYSLALEGAKGSLYVTSNNDNEIAKNGDSSYGAVSIYRSRGRIRLGLGLGMALQKAKASSNGNISEQSFGMNLALADIRAIFRIKHGFHFGLLLRSLRGKGANLNYASTESSSDHTYIGARLEWLWTSKISLFGPFIQQMNTLTNTTRSVNESQIGFTVGFKLKENKNKSKPEKKRLKSKRTVQKEAAPKKTRKKRVIHPPFLLRLGKSSLLFANDSANITPRGQSIITSVASVLRRFPKTWGFLQISGHTNSLGTFIYNQNLSKRRSLAVKSLLVSLRVPETRIVTNGYGDTRLLQKFSRFSSRQRRVTISFGPLKGKHAQKVKNALNKVMANTGTISLNR